MPTRFSQKPKTTCRLSSEATSTRGLTLEGRTTVVSLRFNETIGAERSKSISRSRIPCKRGSIRGNRRVQSMVRGGSGVQRRTPELCGLDWRPDAAGRCRGLSDTAGLLHRWRWRRTAIGIPPIRVIKSGWPPLLRLPRVVLVSFLRQQCCPVESLLASMPPAGLQTFSRFLAEFCWRDRSRRGSRRVNLHSS